MATLLTMYSYFHTRCERWVRCCSQSVDNQPVGDVVINTAVGCHYFPPGAQLPSQPHSRSRSLGDLICDFEDLLSSRTDWWSGSDGTVGTRLEIIIISSRELCDTQRIVGVG